MKAKIEEVHLLRAFGIIGVVLLHTLASNPVHHNMVNKLLNLNLGYVVPLFIFISGMVLSFSSKENMSILDFYKKRLNVVIFPYFIFATLYYLYGLTNNYIPDSKTNIGGYLSWLFMAKTYYHLWFFGMLIQFYLLFPFFLKLCKKFENKPALVMLFALILQLLWSFLNIQFPKATLASIFPYFIFYFVLGIFYALDYSKFTDFINKSRFYIIGAAYILIMYLARLYSLSKLFEPLTFVLMFLLLIKTSIYLRNRNNWLSKSISYIASISFGIYLVHVFCLDFSKYCLINLRISANNYFFNHILFVATLATSVLVCSLISYSPISKYIIGYKK